MLALQLPSPPLTRLCGPPLGAPFPPPPPPPAAGNVARYINHSCDPNLLVHPVLRPGDSGLRYGIAMVAST